MFWKRLCSHLTLAEVIRSPRYTRDAGGMAERTKAAVLKTAGGCEVPPGFESLSPRPSASRPSHDLLPGSSLVFRPVAPWALELVRVN